MMDSIVVDVHMVTDMDKKPYHSKEVFLVMQEGKKKRKYLQACLEQRKHFTPFAISTNKWE
jgi:hypothetical protein